MCSFANSMYCFLRVGSEPGRLASSTLSWAESSREKRRVKVVGDTVSTASSSCFVTLITGFSAFSTSESDEDESRVEVGGAEGADGWEMEFWPVIMVPSSRPAEMW